MTSTRIASPSDASEIAELLVAFNTEFEVPTPAAAVLADRLSTLLHSEDTFAILEGGPARGVALVTLRRNVWYSGRVALLDERYVNPEDRNHGIGSKLIQHLFAVAKERSLALIEINVDEGDIDAQRFYSRHHFPAADPDTHERDFYYYREFE